MNTTKGNRPRGRPRKQIPIDPVMEEIVQNTAPMNSEVRRETDLMLRGLKAGEDMFIGQWRGLGPSRSLALKKALLDEGAYYPEQAGAIQQEYSEKLRSQAAARADGVQQLKQRSSDRDAEFLRRYRPYVVQIRSMQITANRAATIIASRPEMSESIATIRRRLKRVC